MGKNWTDEQIDDLLKQSRKTFGTILPLDVEIEKMNAFIRDMLYSAGKKDGFKFRITKVIFQWQHLGLGWHVTTHEANPSGAYFCPDCFPKGQPEYTKRPYGLDWCNQAEAWMKENNGKK